MVLGPGEGAGGEKGKALTAASALLCAQEGKEVEPGLSDFMLRAKRCQSEKVLKRSLETSFSL